jgi:DNA invertase Pin-like site-specific DNA recombinase
MGAAQATANTSDSADPQRPGRRTSRRGSPAAANNVQQLETPSTHVSAGHLIGYARVSRPDQSLDRQHDALRDVGCERVFDDHGVSGARASRPGLDAMLAYVRPGDTVVIQSLDRLGRTTRDLLTLIENLAAREIGLRILTLGVDTRTPAGQLVLTVMAALAQMERDVLRERTIDGLAAARARGRNGGRPRSLTDEQVEVAAEWHSDGRSAREIARLLGSSERTIRRRLEARAPG